MPNSKNDLSVLKTLSQPSQSVSRRPGRKVPAWILPGGLLLGFLLILALLFGKRLLPAVPVSVAPVITIRAETGVSPAPGATGSGEPRTAPRSLLFQASGWVEPDPYPIAVPALTGGIVDEVFVLEGESVREGQVLATLIDDDAQLNLAEAESRVDTLRSEIEVQQSRLPGVDSKKRGLEKNLLSEKAMLEDVRDHLDRLQSLPPGSIAEREVRAAELKVEQQQARVEEAVSAIEGVEAEVRTIRLEIRARENALREAEVTLDKARLDLDRHTIRSPMEGTVLTLYAAPGRKRMVHMDDHKSAMIVELFDPEKLQARIDVPLSEASAIAVGQPVEMSTDLLSNVELKGTVTRITGEADLQRNTLQVKVAIENPDRRLRPEMLVRGKFYAKPAPLDDKPSSPGTEVRGRLSLFVPEEAIFSGDQVWVATPENTAELRRFTRSESRRENHLLTLGGLRSGERVILPPHDKLKPGSRIRILP